VTFNGRFFGKNSLTACCVMSFEKVEEEEAAILTRIQYTPLNLPSQTAWHTVDEGRMNKLGQAPLQRHTICAKNVWRCYFYNGPCTYKCTIEERLCNHSSRGKAVSITYSLCVYSLSYPAFKVHVPHYIVICALS
jgi:hypothetical protein